MHCPPLLFLLLKNKIDKNLYVLAASFLYNEGGAAGKSGSSHNFLLLAHSSMIFRSNSLCASCAAPDLGDNMPRSGAAAPILLVISFTGFEVKCLLFSSRFFLASISGKELDNFTAINELDPLENYFVK